MKQDDMELLKELCPDLPITRSQKEWLARAATILAHTTQSRDVYNVVVDHTRGDGPWIYDLKGNQYLDMTAGVAVRALGLRHQGLREFEQRIHSYLREVPGQDFDTIPQTLLAERLASLTPGDFEKEVFFCTSGGRAVEAAIKSVFDKQHRFRFVAFRPAFHGRTGYTLALTASKHIHKDYYPQGLDVIRAPYPYCYRCPFGREEGDCSLECIEYLRDSLQYEGTDIAAIVFEPVCGEGGMIPAPTPFVRELRKVADELDALLIDDEVQAGLGRTGRWWAIQHHNVVPDYVCTAKALGGGYPLAACIGPKPMYTDFGRHSETFGAEPYVALVSLYVLRTIEREGLLENARRRGEQLLKGLRDIQDATRIIGDVRGLGLMCAAEIVTDKKSRRPDPKLTKRLIDRCVRKEHLWVISCGRNSVRFIPPLNITPEQIDIALERFRKAVKAVK